jgi:hypothetical protein
METVAADLKEIGIDGRWSYSSLRNGSAYGDGYYLRGHEDVGHFTLAKENGDQTFTSIKFSTMGSPEGINQPIPSVDGSASPRNPSPVAAGAGLISIRDDGLKNVRSTR